MYVRDNALYLCRPLQACIFQTSKICLVHAALKFWLRVFQDVFLLSLYTAYLYFFTCPYVQLKMMFVLHYLFLIVLFGCVIWIELRFLS